MSGQLRQRAVLRGLGWGLVASLLGSWTFTLLAFLKVFYLDPFFDFQLPPPTPSELFADFGVVLVFLFFGFSFSMLSSCIPGMIGGAVLGVLVHYTAPRVARPVRVSTLMGIVVGVMAGVISSCPGLVMFPEDRARHRLASCHGLYDCRPCRWAGRLAVGLGLPIKQSVHREWAIVERFYLSLTLEL